jgi:AmmeMemoRadiSam system protein A
MCPSPDAPEILDRLQRLEGLRLARSATEAWTIRGVRPIPPIPSPLDRVFASAFVTLNLESKLRGCVGSLDPSRPLGETLIDCAIAASCKDTRFPPVTAQELSRLRFEISVLTSFEPLHDPAAIRIGVDGLMLEKSGRRGLLLPQVASQQGWNFESFLDHACLKAGLKTGEWKSDARIQVFRAQVFAEGDPD